MIDIAKVREALENIKNIDIYVDGSFWNYKDTDYKNDVIVIEQALTELERLQKRDEEVRVKLINRIEMNKRLIKNTFDIDTEIVSHLSVENTALELVMMLMNWSDEK